MDNLREFKVLPKVKEFELDMVEAVLEEKIPDIVRKYIMKYGGCSIAESNFIHSSGLEWGLCQFNTFDDIYKLTKEFKEEYDLKLLPFAFDIGGWHFCLSMDKNNFGSIVVNRWTDHLPEDQFLTISENFETFINGLD